MQQSFVFLLIVVFSYSSWAQDERYYRQMLTGDLPTMIREIKEDTVTQYVIKGPNYFIDINDDGIEEIIQPQKIDGTDVLEIRSSSGTKYLAARLFAMGTSSHIYQLKLVRLSPKAKALIVMMDEGVIQAKRVENTARIFLVSFENNDLTTMKVTQGPHHFHEKESQREQYGRRDYGVNALDLDHDGTREVIVQFNHMQRIMKYVGGGEWLRF